MSETVAGAKPKGWFSRRHATDEAHRAAVARYRLAHEKKGESPWRQPDEQLIRLNKRLGEDVGARRERSRRSLERLKILLGDDFEKSGLTGM